MFTLAIVQSALELGFIYALVAMALFLSFRVLNIADMTTDGAFLIRYAAPAGFFSRRSCIPVFIVVLLAPHLHYSLSFFFILLGSYCWVVTSTTWHLHR